MKKYKDYLILIIFTMGTQALIYYGTKVFTSNYHIISSVADIPLIKPFIYFYGSWYPFILLCTFLVYLHDKKLFKSLIATMLIAAFLAQLTFIIYPSEIVRPSIEVKNITDWLIDFTYRSDDPPVNCLPSMHCIYCFITSFYILKCKNLKYRYPIIIYSFLIVISTVLVKQHIIEDIFLAFIYTITTIIIVKINEEKIAKLFNKLKY